MWLSKLIYLLATREINGLIENKQTILPVVKIWHNIKYESTCEHNFCEHIFSVTYFLVKQCEKSLRFNSLFVNILPPSANPRYQCHISGIILHKTFYWRKTKWYTMGTTWRTCAAVHGLNSSNAEATSVQITRMLSFFKLFKPCHVSIHWIALTEYSQMSAHVPGFQSFFSCFASFHIGPN